MPAATARTPSRAAWLAGWLAMAGGPAVAVLMIPGVAGGPTRLAVMCAGLWAGAKGLAWAVRPVRGSWPRTLGWWLAWPGLETRRFLSGHADAPPVRAWVRGAACAAAGIILFLTAGCGAGGTDSGSATRGLLAAAGFVLGLHFGLFHLLALAWRAAGVDAVPLMDRPLSAATAEEFWGRRWNTAFAFLTRAALFRPLARRFGAGPAVWAGFLFSGLLHEAAITLPAGAGFGGPTCYFLLQAAGVSVARRVRPGPVAGRLLAWATVLLPVPLLLPRAFLTDVAGPTSGLLAGTIGL